MSKPRVLVLHGALGSRLGLKGRLLDDELWLDPFDVRRGNLDQISFGDKGNPEVQVLGIMRSAYLAARLRLVAAGMASDFYTYDWRRPVQELGAELADHVAQLGTDDVRLVCHSYGGLVARSALAQGAEAISRVVTLGTPHRGAFSTVMLLRGTHPVLQRIAALDHRGDARALARDVFATFPGSYHLLPFDGLQADFDAFDADAWPTDDPRPDPALLAQAQEGLATLAPVDERFCCVAGIRWDTPRAVRPGGDAGFAYDLGTAGDAVVPIESAAPPGARAWFVPGGHGTLPWTPAILDALPDLVRDGDTDKLSREAGDLPDREGTDDRKLDVAFEELKAQLVRPSAGTLQALLTEYAAPAPDEEEEATEPRYERYPTLEAHGNDPNDYALLQPGMHYFEHGDGFLGYRTSMWRPVVLGDPVVPEAGRADLLRAFLEEHPKAVFFNLSGEAAATLHGLELGFRLCPYGTERILDLEDEGFLTRKRIKGALKKARKGGLELEEVDFESFDEERLTELRAVDREFLERTPSKKEITFISRGVALEPEPGVRVFALRCVDKEGFVEDFGFLVLDPYFIGGEKVGYQLNAIRFRKTRIWGVYYAVVAQLAQQLRSEGFRRLSLGGLAFDLLGEPSAFPHDEKMLRRLEFVQERTDDYYVMSHFTDMKLELGGEPLRRYCAIAPSASVTRSILRFLRVSQMI
jgi:pimeloyl-ACP methyl ester carboxylesterase